MASETLSWEIRLDDLRGREVAALLEEHLDSMALHSPPQSRHALDLHGLRKPDITFWSMWNGSELIGCGALKELDSRHGEVKSMRTASAHLRKRVAARMLRHLIEEAGRRGYVQLFLETGSMAAFEPARKLYEGFGFRYCEPFANYKSDPNSVFMMKYL